MPAKVACAVVVVLALIVLPLATPGSYGSFTASIRNQANTAKAMPFFTCRQALTEETGRVFAYQFDSGRPVNLVTGSSSDTAVNNVTFSNAATGCRHDRNGYVSFAGSTGNPSTVRYTPSVAPPPQTFTQELWFQTGTAQGSLLGMGDKQTYRNENKFDRHLYIGPSGRLVMANYIAATRSFETVQSPAAVTDDKWHHVIATRDVAANRSSLYLDGVLVGSVPLQGTLDSYSPAYWRIGCMRLETWPGGPAQSAECFRGNIGFAAVYNRAFGQQDVTNHYRAGTW